jgi:hypothetical protein
LVPEVWTFFLAAVLDFFFAAVFFLAEPVFPAFLLPFAAADTDFDLPARVDFDFSVI